MPLRGGAEAPKLSGDIERSVEQLVNSPALGASPLLCRFLRFVVERALSGHAAELKESVIGVAVFGREPGYDPKLDPVVRVHARRLRDKLAQYYEANPGATVEVAIPKGGYVPEFRRREAPQATARQGWNWRPLAYTAGAVLLLAAAGWGMASILRRAAPARAIVSRPFTTLDGYANEPAFSPDGKWIAYGWGPGGNDGKIYVQAVASDRPTQLTSGAGNDGSPVFSPDGAEVAYLRTRADGAVDIYSVPSRGGAERKRGEARSGVVAGARPYPRLDWSPDGRWFAVAEEAHSGTPWNIVLISAESGSARTLTTCPPGFAGDSSPMFSPDGRWVAFRRGKASSVEDIYVVATAGGEPRQITHDGRATFGHAWTPDGRSLVVSSSRGGSHPSLWRIPVDGGAPERLTEAGVNAQFPTVARRAGGLAYVSVIADVNLWKMPADGSRPAERVVASTVRDTSPQFSPDGRSIAFRSNRSGYDEIWVAGADGQGQRRLTNFAGPLTGSPRWSPDGRRIALDSRPFGNADIFLIDADGGKPRQLTFEPSNEVTPSWSADGRFVYFASNRTGSWQVWKQGVAGGAAIQVTKQGGFAGFESADGRHFYYAKSNAAPGLWRVPSAGGAEEIVFDGLAAGMWGNWALGRDRIYFVDGSGQAAIAAFELPTGKRLRIAGMQAKPSVGDTGLALSADGNWLVFAQLDRQGNDILLAEQFR